MKKKKNNAQQNEHSPRWEELIEQLKRMGRDDSNPILEEQQEDKDAEAKPYKFEPHPLYPYENKNVKKHPAYKTHKKEIDEFIHWARRVHGDE